MTTTKPATGARAAQDPRQIAWATSSPAIPTYMGLRLIVLAPDVTRNDARSGWNGSTVVPRRLNWLAAEPAIDTEASEIPAAVTARLAPGLGLEPESTRWARAAASATRGGGTGITFATLLRSRGPVEWSGAQRAAPAPLQTRGKSRLHTQVFACMMWA